MDAVGVDGVLLTSSRLYGYDNSYVVESAARFPHRGAAVARIDAFSPDPGGHIDELRAQPGVLGARLVISSAAELYQLERAKGLLAAAERSSLPIFIYPGHSLNWLPALAEAYASLQLIIDHVGLQHPPQVPLASSFSRVPQLLDLAMYENVAIKLSCLPLLSREPFPFADLWPLIERVLDAFGLHRVMWGSDWTQVSRAHTYADALRYLSDSPRLSAGDKDALLGGTLATWLGWQPTGRHPAALVRPGSANG
jgi:L-fuconolactonase